MYLFCFYLQTLDFSSIMVHLADLHRTRSCSQTLRTFVCIVTTLLWQVQVFFFNPNTRADEPAARVTDIAGFLRIQNSTDRHYQSIIK